MNPLIQSYLDECQQLRAGKTYRDYRARLTVFDDFAGTSPAWNRELAVGYLMHLKTTGIGSASISLHEATIRSFFSWLVNFGRLPSNPLHGKAIMPYHSPHRADEFAFTVKEYEWMKKFVLKHPHYAEWYGVMIVGWNTGLRLADVLRLGKEHINQDALLLEPQKTKRFHKQIKMPIQKELQEWLAGFEELPARFFPLLYQSYLRCDSAPSQQFGRILRSCYIAGKSFHSFRHQFVCRHLNAGVPISIVSSMTGQTMKVLQRYSHVTLEDQKKALERMVA